MYCRFSLVSSPAVGAKAFRSSQSPLRTTRTSASNLQKSSSANRRAAEAPFGPSPSSAQALVRDARVTTTTAVVHHLSVAHQLRLMAARLAAAAAGGRHPRLHGWLCVEFFTRFAAAAAPPLLTDASHAVYLDCRVVTSAKKPVGRIVGYAGSVMEICKWIQQQNQVRATVDATAARVRSLMALAPAVTAAIQWKMWIVG